MWLRSAVRLPWNLIGAVTLLSFTAVTFPVRAFSSAFRPRQLRDLPGKKTRRRLMPEVYDAQEVAAMLDMVQAAMQHKSQQLHLERSASVRLQQHIDGLQESLDNTSYLFTQVSYRRTTSRLMSNSRLSRLCSPSLGDVQEQQHRLGLQDELQAAESAAADLRQMLAVFFGDSPACSPDSTSETARNRSPHLTHDSAWTPSSPSQLHSGLPGTLDRRDSRLQMDLAGIQKRLHKIAQLRDTPPSSPRSAERISTWTSPSTTDAASPRSTDLSRSRTLASRLSPSKLSPLRSTTMGLNHKHDVNGADFDNQPHAKLAENPSYESSPVRGSDRPESTSDDSETAAAKIDSSPSHLPVRMDAAVSLDMR